MRYGVLFCCALAGTGVVTSVPSDAPDDYAALMDLRNKEAMRVKFGLRPEQVMPFAVVPIIAVPGLGDTAAATLCQERKVRSQNDRALLEEIKEKVYMEGFYKGVMLVGDFKGQKVCDAKPLVRAQMIQANQAASYAEPVRTSLSSLLLSLSQSLSLCLSLSQSLSLSSSSLFISVSY